MPEEDTGRSKDDGRRKMEKGMINISKKSIFLLPSSFIPA
jgi:hypothetical protein